MKKGFLNNNNSKKKKSNKNSGSSSKAMDETTESMKTLNVTESNNNNNKNNNVKQKVPYTIEDLGNDRVKAVFTVPEEAVAALSAKGTSIIHNIEQIDRGYEDIDNRLRILGASIERI